MHRSWPLLVLAGALLLGGCGDGIDTDTERAPALSAGASTGRGFVANFDLTAGKIPTATDLLLSGTADLTLNIPVPDPTDFSNPRVAINALDGFSTIAPVTTTFSSAIDPSTLTPATVRVFEVSLNTLGGTKPVGGPVRAVTRELTFGVEFVAVLSSVDVTNSTLVILPLAPLKPRTSYLVALTNGIKSADGRSALAADNYYAAKTTPNSLVGTPAAALEPVRQLVQAQEAALAAYGMNPAPVVLSWVFTTQSVKDVLVAARAQADGTPTVDVPLGPTDGLNPALRGWANVYAGALTVPYYLDATNPLSGFWKGNPAHPLGTNLTFANPTPLKTSDQTIPLLLSVPNGNTPHTKPVPTGWPVVIFQHGITKDRTVMLAMADSLAMAGFAVVAIDLPLHGVLPPDHPDGSALYSGFERTFDLDLNGDNQVDLSGSYFINPASLLTTRDNGRQAVADLFSLAEALDEIDYDGDGTFDLDTDEIYFVGHSLGAMVGTVFLALEDRVKSAVLGMPGGGIAKLLDGSAAFSQRIAAGLAAKGVIRGTPEFESFMGAFQTVVDSADPLNYTSGAVEGRGVLLYEVVGSATSASDLVVPINVLPTNPQWALLDNADGSTTVPSFTAGTDPLWKKMGLQQIGETTPNSGLSLTPLHAVVRFTAGGHGSLLLPTDAWLPTGAADESAEGQALAYSTFLVMQEAAGSFLATDGKSVVISDTSVVEAQP